MSSCYDKLCCFHWTCRWTRFYLADHKRREEITLSLWLSSISPSLRKQLGRLPTTVFLYHYDLPVEAIALGKHVHLFAYSATFEFVLWQVNIPPPKTKQKFKEKTCTYVYVVILQAIDILEFIPKFIICIAMEITIKKYMKL